METWRKLVAYRVIRGTEHVTGVREERDVLKAFKATGRPLPGFVLHWDGSKETRVDPREVDWQGFVS